jgi:hypothetical protein
MVIGDDVGYVPEPMADRVIFQGDGAASEDKAVLWECKECSDDPDEDSGDSISAFYLLKMKAKKAELSFANFISVIKTMFFERRPLFEWIENPVTPLPVLQEDNRKLV